MLEPLWSALKSVSSAYHGLVKCNHGFNGEDSGSLEDSEVQALEAPRPGESLARAQKLFGITPP